MNQIVIDATNAILGRLASYAAKQSLLGKKVVIVNCSKAVLTGRKQMIVDEYGTFRRRGGTSMKGPFFPKIPERIVKRTVRGMLAYQKGRGDDAFKRVICYNNTPKEYEAAKKLLAGKEKRVKVMSLADLSDKI